MSKRRWENDDTKQYKRAKVDIFGSESEEEPDVNNKIEDEEIEDYDSSISEEEEKERKKIKEEVHEMKINDLRKQCKEFKISTKGVKQVIAERLCEYILQQKMKKIKSKKSKTKVENNVKKPISPSIEYTKNNDFPIEPSICSHSKQIKINLKVKKNLFNPSLWSCEQCGTTGSVRCCLICGYFGCGKKFNSHSLVHFDSTGHPLVFSIHSKTACCYVCKEKITDLEEIQEICKGIKIVEERDFEMGVNDDNMNDDHSDDDEEELEKNSLRKSATALFISPKLYEIEDCYSTSLQHYRKYQISRFFRALTNLTQEKQSNQFFDQLNGKNGNNSPKIDSENMLKNAPMVPVSPIIKVNRTGPTGTPVISPLRTRAANVSGNNDRIIENGFTGLRNLGNTCFMNSVIQSITSNERIRNYFIEELIPSSGDNSISLTGRDLVRTDTYDCLTSISSKSFIPKSDSEISLCLEMHKLLRVLWSGKWTIVTPYSLLYSLWELLPAFKNYKQQDAEEFLCYLLDKIHEELKAAMEKEKIEIPNNIKLNNERQTIINEIFGGQIASRVICINCGNESVSIERFFDVAIDIPVEHFATGRKKRNEKIPACSLYDCLDRYTNVERLEENSYKCDSCYQSKKILTSATKQMVFHQLPEVLCITIKRFSWINRAKIDTIVKFPLQKLDMKKYAEPRNKHLVYNLKSLIVHHGRSLNVGHYTSFAYNTAKGGNWLHYNDSKVRIVAPETVEECYGETPYILFYEREKPSLFAKIQSQLNVEM